MKYFLCLAILFLLFVSQGKTEPKISKVLPEEYIGAWSIGSCKHYEKCGDMSDELMEISPKTLNFYEVTCDIQKVTKLKNHSLKVEVYCYEYGANRKEIFYIQLRSSQEIRMVGGVFANATTYFKCAEPSTRNCNE
jgi:hypothetical protein